MANRRLLLLSNSRNPGQGYLEHAFGDIKDFLGKRVTKVLFIPFAGVRTSFDDYSSVVGERFESIGYKLDPIHKTDPAGAVKDAEAIVIGGGNTFHLLRLLYDANLLDGIRERVAGGIPFIGWSAGSNVACPTIKTTNDMPIIEPPSFNALGLVSFQINPHYTDFHPPGHQGETRDDRIAEFIELNPGVYVVGLREGSILRIEGSQIRLLGEKEAKIFMKGRAAAGYAPGQSLEFLL